MASQADVRRIALSLPEPHYNGFPAVLVRLPAVKVRELKALITEAWRCQAPKDLDTKGKAPRRRGVARR